MNDITKFTDMFSSWWPKSFPSSFPMTFMWPTLLWLLLLVPLLVAVYVWLLRRKKKASLRFASLSIVREAMDAGPSFRRHVPPILFLLGHHHDAACRIAPICSCHTSDAARNHHAGDGCLWQHACDRCVAHPHGGSAKCRQSVFGRAAPQYQSRHCGFCRIGASRANSNSEPRRFGLSY